MIPSRRYILSLGLALVAAAGLAANLLGFNPVLPGSPVAAAQEAPVQPDSDSLTGIVSRQQLESFPGWEDLRAADYSPNLASVDTIRSNSTGLEIILFVGSWCGDSKREVPRFFKIMDMAGVPDYAVTILGLDRTKRDADGFVDLWNVKYVPTFIFLRNGRELGRVVERPASSLEADIAKILAPPIFPQPASSSTDVQTVTVSEVNAMLAAPGRPPIFDARSKSYYDESHVAGAISLPVDDLESRIAEVPMDSPSIFYCWGKT